MVAKLLMLGLLSLAQSQAANPTPHIYRPAEGEPRPAVKVANLSWLTGHWAGEGLGGTVEEVWSDASGGTMVGYFRLIREGKPVFYEIMTLLERDGSVEMRLKHVNPDMNGWEEKADFVTFALVKLEPNAAYFKGLTFKRDGDTLVGYVALRNRADGSVREETFTFRRRF